jgi:hypothetical protein
VINWLDEVAGGRTGTGVLLLAVVGSGFRFSCRGTNPREVVFVEALELEEEEVNVFAGGTTGSRPEYKEDVSVVV